MANSTASSKTPGPPKTASITFYPDGDVVLVVQGQSGTARLLASSQVLSLSSPVFHAMLNPKFKFKEGRELAAWSRGCYPAPDPVEIHLGDDDPETLAITLRALHHQHRYVPKSMPPARLYQVAILCDKYDMHEALEFVLEKWVPRDLERELGEAILPDQWLFIAWAFGREELFRCAARKMVLESYLNDEGELCVRPWKEMFMSKDFVLVNQYLPEQLIDYRRRAIDAIMDRIQEAIVEHKLFRAYIWTLNDASSLRLVEAHLSCFDFVMEYIKLSPRTPELKAESVLSLRGVLDIAEDLHSTREYMEHNDWTEAERTRLELHLEDHGMCDPYGDSIRGDLDWQIDEILKGVTPGELEYINFRPRRTRRDTQGAGNALSEIDELWNCLRYE